MGLDGKIYRLECVRDYDVAEICVIRDTSCVYDGGLPYPLRCTTAILALKNDFNSSNSEEIQMLGIMMRCYCDLTV